mmetsp:Transcript_51048/g.128109  ORF Transcript_51048/g.128109 Transcript_51048/m.128109 type:complete len:219 (+) Transcript_51048:750-1406(+)
MRAAHHNVLGRTSGRAGDHVLCVGHLNLGIDNHLEHGTARLIDQSASLVGEAEHRHVRRLVQSTTDHTRGIVVHQEHSHGTVLDCKRLLRLEAALTTLNQRDVTTWEFGIVLLAAAHLGNRAERRLKITRTTVGEHRKVHLVGVLHARGLLLLEHGRAVHFESFDGERLHGHVVLCVVAKCSHNVVHCGIVTIFRGTTVVVFIGDFLELAQVMHHILR